MELPLTTVNLFQQYVPRHKPVFSRHCRYGPIPASCSFFFTPARDYGISIPVDHSPFPVRSYDIVNLLLAQILGLVCRIIEGKLIHESPQMISGSFGQVLIDGLKNSSKVLSFEFAGTIP